MAGQCEKIYLCLYIDSYGNQYFLVDSDKPTRFNDRFR